MNKKISKSMIVKKKTYNLIIHCETCNKKKSRYCIIQYKELIKFVCLDCMYEDE